MLSNAIGGLLPSAIGVALSPIPIIAVVLMLSTPRARSNGPAFAVGWIAGLAAVSAIVVFVVGATSSASTDDTIAWGKVALGVVFLGMARRQWQKRPASGQEPEMPGWMATLDAITPPKSLGLGLLLSAANPKNLALTLAAAASIAQTSGLSDAQETVAIVVFVALSSVTVVGSVLFYLVAPKAAERPLASLKSFMTANNAVIMMVVLLLLGAKLLGDGIGGAL